MNVHLASHFSYRLWSASLPISENYHHWEEGSFDFHPSFVTPFPMELDANHEYSLVPWLLSPNQECVFFVRHQLSLQKPIETLKINSCCQLPAPSQHTWGQSPQPVCTLHEECGVRLVPILWKSVHWQMSHCLNDRLRQHKSTIKTDRDSLPLTLHNLLSACPSCQLLYIDKPALWSHLSSWTRANLIRLAATNVSQWSLLHIPRRRLPLLLRAPHGSGRGLLSQRTSVAGWVPSVSALFIFRLVFSICQHDLYFHSVPFACTGDVPWCGERWNVCLNLLLSSVRPLFPCLYYYVLS